VLGRHEAIDAIVQLVRDGRGGTVFTPNVDHVVQAEHNQAFREAYARTALSLVDGTPVLWAARLLGTPLPEKLSGSDLFDPLLRARRRRARRGKSKKTSPLAAGGGHARATYRPFGNRRGT
jgi:N-acetylglucosaminyldiphosphoundecaprenol N-acetyl-beta-D-mannosaminyltransferase